MIKAIETSYKGYRFRSRLEARWAILFDELEIEWEYEKEGFELGENGRYLPDFEVLSKNGDEWFVEVKGDMNDGVGLNKAGYLDEHSIQLGKMGVIILGNPEHAFWTGENNCAEFNHAFIVAQRLGVGIGKYNAAINEARSARFEFGETPCKY